MAVKTEREYGPNHEAVEAILERISEIPWFNPPDQLSLSDLQLLINEFRERLNAPTASVTIVRDWNTARTAARDEILDETQAAVRDAAPNAAWNATWTVARDAAWTAAWDAALAAAPNAAWDAAPNAAWDAARCADYFALWEIIEDLMPEKGYEKGNPFESLLKVWEFGCWPIGLVPNPVNPQEKQFVIFVPPVEKT